MADTSAHAHIAGHASKGHCHINGTNNFYAQFGQGRPVLLLHGGLANSNYWGHQVGYLAESFLVIVVQFVSSARFRGRTIEKANCVFCKQAVAERR